MIRILLKGHEHYFLCIRIFNYQFLYSDSYTEITITLTATTKTVKVDRVKKKISHVTAFFLESSSYLLQD